MVDARPKIPSESIKLRHFAGQRQNVAFLDKRKIVPILGYQLGFKNKTALYDQIFTLGAGELDPHDICYDSDRNRIWIICYTNPPRVLRMNPEDFTYDTLILAGVNDQGYRIAYDGKWIWATTATPAAPAWVIRINPDTLAYVFLQLPNDGKHVSAPALAIGKGYAWVGCGSVNPTWAAWVLRFERDTTPLTYAEVNLRPGAVPPFWGIIRELVFDGQRVWASGSYESPVAWVDPNTLVVTQAVNSLWAGQGTYSGYFDGSFLWWGSEDGRIAKMNPDTYAYDSMQLELATGLIHRMSFDGKYLHMINYTNGTYYIIDPETMEYTIHELTGAALHGVCFDGLNIWILDIDWGNPGRVWRVLQHQHERRVDHAQTATVDITVIGIKTIAVTFDVPFTRVPIVVVSLNNITDAAGTAVITNIEANTVTVNGFTVSCKVTIAGGALSTARFMWIATERSTHHP